MERITRPGPLLDESDMQLAIMQPYFLPYLGYFSLIAASDRFVVFDSVQYIRHGWINRNRILKPCHSTAQHIIVPLERHARDTKIRDIRISNRSDWRSRILRQLEHYKKRAPFFRDVMNCLRDGLALQSDSISKFNRHLLASICDLIAIPFRAIAMEEVKLENKRRHAGDWALDIAVALKASRYVNAPGGQHLFDAEQFSKQGVELQFIQNRLTPYAQSKSPFVAGLSILDALMFLGPEETRQLVFDFDRVIPRNDPPHSAMLPPLTQATDRSATGNLTGVSSSYIDGTTQ